MRTIDPPLSVPKVRTEIDGFDLIANGGLPQGRATLLSGTSGSAKTVFAAQFLAAGITRAGENGVFVTFEESPQDIRNNRKASAGTSQDGKPRGGGPLWMHLPSPATAWKSRGASIWRR